MKYLLIINPKAGKSKYIEADIENLFKKKKKKLTIKKTKNPLDAKKFAKRAIGNFDVVIAAGGDGTINEVVNGLANSNVKMGIIPIGTENVLAQELKIPFNHLKAAERILKKKHKIFDLGKANKRYFVLMCGIGLDAKAAASVEPFLKKFFGRTAYHISALKTTLTHIPKKLEIHLDDQILPRWGYFAIIGNIKYYGGNISFTPLANYNDGYLDICIFKNRDLFNNLKYFIGAASKGKIPLLDFSNVEYFRVKKIKIKSKNKVLAHTDAESIGSTPVTINVVPKAIKILC